MHTSTISVIIVSEFFVHFIQSALLSHHNIFDTLRVLQKYVKVKNPTNKMIVKMLRYYVKSVKNYIG